MNYSTKYRAPQPKVYKNMYRILGREKQPTNRKPKYSPVDRLCGLVVRVSGYRYRGPRFDPRRYQIF